jgi:HTH-type transcriptional regulator/antitoxin HigA
MKPKLIKTETDYKAALARIDQIFDAKPGTPEGDELDLLATLVELYEDKAFPIDPPDPIAAIRFRMEQANLKAKDLIPYIGSASKVSEVLSGRRTLSLTMIRNLVNELGLPAAALLKTPSDSLSSKSPRQQGRDFPIAQMVKRGWFSGFQGTIAEAKAQLVDLMSGFIAGLGPNALIPALNRQHIREGSKQNEYALTAWRIRVATLALRESLPTYKPGTVTATYLRELVRLSYFDSGPLLAKEYLNKSGIHMICERHLPRTHLDGAALKLPDNSAVVALTLRYDRLDNFWFTLFHELAHVALHLDTDDVDAFFDDLTQEGRDAREKEADKFAAEALIPSSAWKPARLNKKSDLASVVAFAEKLRISPSIPAGRIRFETKDYTVLKQLLGAGKLRPMFGVKEN